MIQASVSDGRYLKDRASLYLLFLAVVVAFSVIVLLLPYDTVYVKDRAYLGLFLATVIASVAVFLLGVLYNVLVWMRGKGLAGSPEGRLLKLVPKVIRFVMRKGVGRASSVFAKEALYLSKLKDRSVTRWLMHLLILGGFLATFVLDLIVTFSLDIVKYRPMIEEQGWAKMWIRDFGFDLAGSLMLIGLVIAAGRRFVLKPKIVRTELPDAVSILFLLAVVLGGFILEGIGIAGRIEGHQMNDVYSFLGYAFSRVTPSSWGQYYDQVWLVHGVMSSLLIAYIPFSKLFHMIATPIAIEADKTLPKEVAR